MLVTPALVPKQVILRSLSFMTLFVFFSCQVVEKEKDQQPPDIIFIMADDHAYQAISAYDNRWNSISMNRADTGLACVNRTFPVMPG